MTMLSSFLFFLPLKKRCIKQKDKDGPNVESFTQLIRLILNVLIERKSIENNYENASQRQSQSSKSFNISMIKL